MKKYVVIGGQYQSYYCGESDSLHGAKIIAAKNMEYWDNWAGWHYPKIYLSEDVEPTVNFFGAGYAPIPGANPVAIRTYGYNWEYYDW